MNIGIALTDAVADADGNVVDETVRLTRQAAEVMFTQTNLLGEETRLRTWRLLGELADR